MAPSRKKQKPDVYWNGVRRRDEETDPDFPILRVCSNDVGSSNWGTGCFALVTTPGTHGLETIVYAEHKAVLTFQTGAQKRSPGTGTASAEDQTRHMFHKFASPRMAWHWQQGSDTPIICEAQVDQLPGFRGAGYGQAVNFGTYKAFHMLCLAHQKPELVLDAERDGLEADEIADSLKRKDLFESVSSRAKLGVRHLSDKERKKQSGPLAMAYYRETGQDHVADWMASLASQKPQEDAGDILHQARWYLEARHKERIKARKKRQRTTSARPRKRQKRLVCLSSDSESHH